MSDASCYVYISLYYGLSNSNFTTAVSSNLGVLLKQVLIMTFLGTENNHIAAIIFWNNAA